jgi:hypothetical protein
MPPIIRACYDSVQKYRGQHPVHLITKSNCADFVSIPYHIMKKLNSGLITVTHFSDILRTVLLYEYGGIWMDATILVTEAIDFNNLKFYTMKETLKTDNISKARWAGFFLAIGSRGNL